MSLRKAATDALEYLDATGDLSTVQDNLRAALAEDEDEGEPVAWMSETGRLTHHESLPIKHGWKNVTPLYTHPARKLSDCDINDAIIEKKILGIVDTRLADWFIFARAIEAKIRGCDDPS